MVSEKNVQKQRVRRNIRRILCQFTVQLFLLRFNYIIQNKSGSTRIIFCGYFKIYTFVFKEFNKITVLNNCAIGI